MGAIAAAIAGGAALTAGGGIMGAQSSNRAARQARDFADMRWQQGRQGLWNALYGNNAGNEAIKWVDGIGWTYPTGQNPPTAGANSILGRQRATADLYGQRARGIEGQFDQGVAGLNDLYGASEGLAAQYGAGGEKLIDEEAARALKGANRLSKAQLTAAGFGNSTSVANQQAQNAVNSARGTAAAKLALRGQALDRRLGVRGQRAAAGQQNIGRRSDLYTNLLGNEMSFRQQPTQTELSALMSSINNPWLGQATSQFYPGVSAGGTALTTGGNALGLYGGYLAGQQRGGGWGGGGATYSGMPGETRYPGNFYA